MLYGASDKAFREKKIACDVNIFNNWCTDRDKLDATSVNNQYFFHTCQNPMTENTVLDDIAKTRKAADGLPLRVSTLWIWSECNNHSQNSLYWNGVYKDSGQRVLEIVDSADV